MKSKEPKMILVVEDTKNLREIVALTLRARGWGVIESDNGDDALEKAMTLEPDLIVLDVMLPGKTGFEICSILRNDDRYKNLPILILSGITQGLGKTDEHWRQMLNADALVSKPFRAYQLVQTVEGLLRGASKPESNLTVQD